MENGNQPATKQDIAEVRTEIAEVRTEIAEVRTGMKAMEDRLIEVFRDSQTEMLKAFYSFAQSTDAKLKDSELSDIMLRQRLTAVESRLTELEKRFNLPPAA